MANTTGKKYGGRKKGTPNKETAALRERVGKLLDDNWDKIEKDLEEVTGKERLDIYTKLLEYALPKLSRVELEQDEEKERPVKDLSKLTEQELEFLDQIWDKLNSDTFDPVTIFKIPDNNRN